MRSKATLLLAISAAAACANLPPAQRVHAFRLKPGDDLLSEIQRHVDEAQIEAGWIATCVGSLTDWTLRFADQSAGASGTGRFEILSLSGTVSKHGSHLHLAIADAAGNTIGGHLLRGCRVYTTAEIVIAESTELEFTRTNDGTTPWKELQIRHRARAAAASPQ
jgi:predicted DNA-binding protein with PD1-like motif